MMLFLLGLVAGIVLGGVIVFIACGILVHDLFHGE